MPTPNKPHPSVTLAISSGFPIAFAAAAAALTYGLSNGDTASAQYTAKIVGVTAGSFMTGLEALACICASVDEYEYCHGGEGNWRFVRKTAEQITTLKAAWAGVAISALTLGAVGYFGPEDQPEQAPKIDSHSVTDDTKKVEAPYKTENGYTLTLA